MKTSRLILTCILLTFVAALPAMAGPRIFVSGLGNDANPGTREQPKRTFASALTVTDPGGEVVVLDPAGFGSSPLTITKSVSIIVPPGIFGGIRVPLGNAITVAAGANDTVILRGLTLNSGGGDAGIEFQSGAALQIENCIINAFTFYGVHIAAPGNIYIKDTLVRNSGFYGVVFGSGAGTVRGTIEHCRVENNKAAGLVLRNNSTLFVRDSVVSGNGQAGPVGNFDGVRVEATTADLTLENCLVSGNAGSGLYVGPGTARISSSTFVKNGGYGLENHQSTLESRGNNTVRANGAGIAFGAVDPIPGL